MHVECARQQFSNTCCSACRIYCGHAACGEEQLIRYRANVTIRAKQCFDVPLERGRKRADTWPAAEASERHVHEQVLGPLAPHAFPVFGTSNASHSGECPLDASEHV